MLEMSSLSLFETSSGLVLRPRNEVGVVGATEPPALGLAPFVLPFGVNEPVNEVDLPFVAPFSGVISP